MKRINFAIVILGMAMGSLGFAEGITNPAELWILYDTCKMGQFPPGEKLPFKSCREEQNLCDDVSLDSSYLHKCYCRGIDKLEGQKALDKINSCMASSADCNEFTGMANGLGSSHRCNVDRIKKEAKELLEARGLKVKDGKVVLAFTTLAARKTDTKKELESLGEGRKYADANSTLAATEICKAMKKAPAATGDPFYDRGVPCGQTAWGCMGGTLNRGEFGLLWYSPNRDEKVVRGYCGDLARVFWDHRQDIDGAYQACLSKAQIFLTGRPWKGPLTKKECQAHGSAAGDGATPGGDSSGVH